MTDDHKREGSVVEESEYERSLRMMAGELSTEEVVDDAERRAEAIMAALKRGHQTI